MESTHGLLKKYWGYSAFLPHQQEIIKSILDGRDTLAVMQRGAENLSVTSFLPYTSVA
jgi:ATP-dependent DNA helicase RecQ